MRQDIKAIETRYKGYRFRSRTEARWAVAFDELGWKWEYEPDGFELPNGERYLPDFKFPSSGAFVEIKGFKPSKEECREIESKLMLTVLSSGGPCGWVIYGPPVEDTEVFRFRVDDGGKWVIERITLGYICSAWPNMISAIYVGKSARFEHGESGAG